MFLSDLDDIQEASSSEDDFLQTQKVKRKKKRGRKAQRSQTLLDDLVDIIISSEYFEKKLIFTNTKYQWNGEICKNILVELKECATAREEQVSFDYIQVRAKFKKVISECKSVALTIKTASGIARFVDEKNYGKWFSDLYATVKTRDACRPELAVEPSCSELSSMVDEISEEGSTNKASTSSNKERLVINKRSRKKRNRMLSMKPSF